mgnify:CR=1 FL=1
MPGHQTQHRTVRQSTASSNYTAMPGTSLVLLAMEAKAFHCGAGAASSSCWTPVVSSSTFSGRVWRSQPRVFHDPVLQTSPSACTAVPQQSRKASRGSPPIPWANIIVASVADNGDRPCRRTRAALIEHVSGAQPAPRPPSRVERRYTTTRPPINQGWKSIAKEQAKQPSLPHEQTHLA